MFKLWNGQNEIFEREMESMPSLRGVGRFRSSTGILIILHGRVRRCDEHVSIIIRFL